MSSPADTTASSPTGQHLWLLLFSLINRVSSMSPWFRSCVWIGSLDIDLNHQISASNGLLQSHHLFQFPYIWVYNHISSEISTFHWANASLTWLVQKGITKDDVEEAGTILLGSNDATRPKIPTPPSTVYYNRVRELTAQRRLPNGWRHIRTLNRFLWLK